MMKKETSPADEMIMFSTLNMDDAFILVKNDDGFKFMAKPMHQEISEYTLNKKLKACIEDNVVEDDLPKFGLIHENYDNEPELFFCERPLQRIGKDVQGGTLLNACKKGHFELVKQLVDDGADLEEKDFSEAITLGATPLMHACLRGDTEIVKYLIDRRAQLEAKDNNGHTCLHYACNAIGFHFDLIKYLKSCGVDVKIKDDIGENILHKICRRFFVSMGEAKKKVAQYVEYFVEEGVDLYQNNNYDMAPYDHLRSKDKHVLRIQFDCKPMIMSKVLLVSLGYKCDKTSTLCLFPNDIINEINKKIMRVIGLPSAQAEIWKPVSKKAGKLHNKLYKTQCDLSNETMNIARILTWSKEERMVISQELMRIENSTPVGL